MREQAPRRVRWPALLAVAFFAGTGCGGTNSPASPTPASSSTTSGTYLYARGVDGVWGFRLGVTGELQPVTGSPMSISEVPSFHPQGQYAVATIGLQVSLYSVSAEGVVGPSALQTIDTAPLLGATPSARPLNAAVWNPTGTILGVTGADDPSGAYTGSALFFSFANGRLTQIPGSPLPAGDFPAYLLFSQDGLAYAFQWGTFREPNIATYRVSSSGAAFVSTSVLRDSAYGPPGFLDNERFIFVAGGVFARTADGTLLEVGGSPRIANPGAQAYQLQSFYTRALDQRLALFQSYRTGRDGRFNVLFAESIDGNGRLASSGADAVLDLVYEWVVTTARGGRVVLTKSNAQGIRAWPVDASGNFGAPRAAGITTFGDPRGAADPTGQFAYFMWSGVDGIPSLRVAPDAQVTRFDALPAGVPFRLAAGRNRIVFNTR